MWEIEKCLYIWQAFIHSPKFQDSFSVLTPKFPQLNPNGKPE